MALPGKGFLAIWNDVLPAEEAEWLRWHTREHMPERVGVPGFLGGRRYLDPSPRQQRYFTLYLGEALSTFNGAPYVERLNTPTPWTSRMSPHFRNFVRGACETVASTGLGVGGAITTVRLRRQSGHGVIDPKTAAGLVAKLIARDGILAAHIGLADASVTGVPTRERALRGATEEPVFDGVVLVEGTGRTDLASHLDAIRHAIADAELGVTPAESAIYDLSLSLAKSDLV